MKGKKADKQHGRNPKEEDVTRRADADQLMDEERDQWVFQSVRMAQMAAQVDDARFRKALADKKMNKVELGWITAVEILEHNAELLKRTILRAATLRAVDALR
jgi:hypothetical protein